MGRRMVGEMKMRFSEHPFIARLGRLMNIEPGDLDDFTQLIEDDRVVSKQHDLVVQGDEFRNLCFVRDGYAIRYRLLRNGKRQILNVILPGDVIGFPVGFFESSIYSVVAVSGLTYNVCPFAAYVQLCYQRPKFGLALSWLMAQEAATYAEHVVGLGRRRPVERLANFLLEIHSRLRDVGRADETGFDLPFSQKIMSDVLGLSVPHLNRTMQQLRSDGLISSHPPFVEFTDIASLKKLAQYQSRELTKIPPGVTKA